MIRSVGLVSAAVIGVALVLVGGVGAAGGVSTGPSTTLRAGEIGIQVRIPADPADGSSAVLTVPSTATATATVVVEGTGSTVVPPSSGAVAGAVSGSVGAGPTGASGPDDGENPSAPGGLAFTGGPFGVVIALAGLALLVGVLLAVLSRRRRPAHR
jgi:hypothetical protein